MQLPALTALQPRQIADVPQVAILRLPDDSAGPKQFVTHGTGFEENCESFDSRIS